MVDASLQIPPDLQDYAEARNFRGVFEDLMREVFSGPLPYSESHLRIQLMALLRSRHTKKELDSIGLKLRPPVTITPNFSPNDEQSPRAAAAQAARRDLKSDQLERSLVDKPTLQILAKLERGLKAEAEIELVRKELLLSFMDVEDLQALFNKFDTEEAGALSVMQLVYAFDYYYSNNPEQLNLVHNYFEAVAANEDYQMVKFTDFLRIASLVDESKFLAYADKIGFPLDHVKHIKNCCLEVTAYRDPCFLYCKSIHVQHNMLILRKLGRQPSQKHVTAYLRKNVKGHPDDDPNRGFSPRIDLREFLLLLKYCPTDHEARAQRSYRVPDDHMRAYREVFESYASRENGYLSSAEVRIVLSALGIELPDSVIGPLLREALEDPLNLELMAHKTAYKTEWLDFIEFLSVVRKYHHGTAQDRIDIEDLECQHYHIPDVKDMNAHWRSNTFFERGQWWNKGKEHSYLHLVYPYLGNHQDVPYQPRVKLWLYGNYAYLMKIEYIFFYLPTFLVLSLCMPAYAALYAIEDCIDCDMCIKVIGRQWYWVYEVESPTGDDDE